MANVKQTTVTGTVAGAPYPPHALPNTVTPASKALWVQAGTVANVATIFLWLLRGKHPPPCGALVLPLPLALTVAAPPPRGAIAYWLVATGLALARPRPVLNGGR